jgi:hypothetical protein
MKIFSAQVALYGSKDRANDPIHKSLTHSVLGVNETCIGGTGILPVIP